MQADKNIYEEVNGTCLLGEALISPPEAQRVLGVSPGTLKKLV